MWRVGLFWGFGHILGMLLIGILFLLLKEYIPVESISKHSEQLVGLVLKKVPKREGPIGVKDGLALKKTMPLAIRVSGHHRFLNIKIDFTWPTPPTNILRLQLPVVPRGLLYISKIDLKATVKQLDPLVFLDDDEKNTFITFV